MTLTRDNIRVIGYLVWLSIAMFVLNTFIDFIVGSIYWELGLAIMGLSIILLAALKDQRYDRWIITAFTWGLGFFLSDLQSFITIVFGGALI